MDENHSDVTSTNGGSSEHQVRLINNFLEKYFPNFTNF